MAKKTIHIDGGTTSFEIDKSRTAYVLDKNETLSFSKIATDPAGNIDDIVLTINGTLTTSVTALEIGAANSRDNTVIIGKAGIVDSRSDAIVLLGDNTTFINRGTVYTSGVSDPIAVMSTGDDGRFTNAGFLKADVGFDITGNGNRVVNSGVMANFSGTIGIEFHSVAGDVNRVINTGIMHGTVGVIGADGREIIINKGEMTAGVQLGGGDDIVVTSGIMGGDVNLDAGNDRFTLRGNGNVSQLAGGAGDDVLDVRRGNELSVSSTIYGGADDDVFIISRNDLALGEFAGGGTDTVKSTVSFTLADEFENLVLIGTKAINGTGNGTANALTGNDARNTLSGMGGMDILNGAGGNDVLTGGTAADLFVFQSKSGKDVITDFTDGSDRIDLSDYKGIGAFQDLEGRISQNGADTVITLKNGDRITLDNVDAGNLTVADFQF